MVSYNEHLATVWPIGRKVHLEIGTLGFAAGEIVAHSKVPDGGAGLVLHVRMTEELGQYCKPGDIRKEAVGMGGGDALAAPASIKGA